MQTMDIELGRRWTQLPAPLERMWSDRPMLVLDGGAPWAFGPVEEPLVMPGWVIRRLEKIAALDLPFQRLAVAHELDPEGPVAGLLPALRDGPLVLTAHEARAVVGPPRTHPVLRRTARLLERMVGRAAMARAAEKILDPILFGVVGAPDLAHGRPALFYPLVAWRW
jgi:hypothetical protein